MTGKIFLKFSCKINPYKSQKQAEEAAAEAKGDAPKKEEAAPAQEQEDTGAKGLLKKGLKGLFD